MTNATPRAHIRHHPRQSLHKHNRASYWTAFVANRAACALIREAVTTGDNGHGRNIILRPCGLRSRRGTVIFRQLYRADFAQRLKQPGEHFTARKTILIIGRSGHEDFKLLIA
jgi:hypothetical protein